MTEESQKNTDEISQQINLLSQQFDKLAEDVTKLLSNENELYAQQLADLTHNHEMKLSLLEQWREESQSSIEKDRNVKVQYFEEDRLKKKAEIPTFMKQSIQKQFDSLKSEFSEAYNLFLDQDIPFINDFSKKEPTSVYEVDSSQQPFLSISEIKKDEIRIKNLANGDRSNNDYRIGILGEFTNDIKSYHVGSDITIQFEKLTPIHGKITRINSQSPSIEFLAANSTAPISISLKSINTKIIQII